MKKPPRSLLSSPPRSPMTAGLLDDVQSGKQQYWFNTQIGKGLVIADQYLEIATGGCGERALHYSPFRVSGLGSIICHFQFFNSLASSWICQQIVFIRIQEQSTIFNFDFGARFFTVQTTQMIIKSEWSWNIWPPIGRLYSLRNSNVSSYYALMTFDDEISHGDEVGSISSQSTTGSVTTSVMNWRTIYVEHVQPLNCLLSRLLIYSHLSLSVSYSFKSKYNRKLVWFRYK